MKTLASYVCDSWVRGTGKPAVLVNPTTEEPLAETSTADIEFAKALEFARAKGGPAMRAMTFAERGQLLQSMADAIANAREELIALAIANGGNTRKDAKFDIDGATVTLAAYADLGMRLGDVHILTDGEPVQIGRTSRLQGHHILTPRTGVAVHVNAFNFPAWGLAEKAATALLAGMPVVSKPATATALVAHRITEILVDAKCLPPGALSLVCGSPGDLLEHLAYQDVLAFTGSGHTARVLRRLRGVVEEAVPINVEADSLNAALLGPDADASGETMNLFLTDVARDMTQKAGQKCTAIRRVVVPADMLDEVGELLSERLAEVRIGDPADSATRMGPVSSAAQLRDVRDGIQFLANATDPVYGGTGDTNVGEGKGYFLGPVLRAAKTDPRTPAVHDREVFGPVATLIPYDTAAQAADIIALGRGGLVASVYSDDRKFLGEVIPALAPHHGRLYIGSAKMAAQSPGPGTVLPQLVHGGPGRAGGGIELGGSRGMRLYQNCTALAGDKSILKQML